jgi:hypothetical protein
MIAPQEAHGKGGKEAIDAAKTGKNGTVSITNSLKGPTITPYFGQSPVTSAWQNSIVASRPGPVDLRIPQPPSPPGVIRPGQLS